VVGEARSGQHHTSAPERGIQTPVGPVAHDRRVGPGRAGGDNPVVGQHDQAADAVTNPTHIGQDPAAGAEGGVSTPSVVVAGEEKVAGELAVRGAPDDDLPVGRTPRSRAKSLEAPKFGDDPPAGPEPGVEAAVEVVAGDRRRCR